MFNKLKIRGGVHAEERKEQSTGQPVRTLGIPPRLHLPLRQHAGKPAEPVVKVGDRVKKGQLIATSTGEDVCASLHAPTSGTVTAIGEVVAPHPSQLTTTAITIESDGLDESLQPGEQLDPMSLTPAEIADRVDQAGIVGLGGATFPAALKLKSGARQKIDTLILNGSECEPYLTCDDMLMRERGEGIISGARLIQRAIGANRIVAGIEDNKPEAIAAMTAAAAPYADVLVQPIPTRYPMGSAKQLIQAIMGREVPAGGRSSDVGALVHNVATAYAVHQALYEHRPLISRLVTVSGQCIEQPQNVEVLLGTPVSWMLEQCGSLSQTPARVVMGGPMMGQILHTTEVPITKGASGILALANPEISKTEPSPCIRCGSCVSACPMGLVPLEMARHAKGDDFDGAKEFGLRDCILCGSCAYVCPSHIPLVHYFQFAKGELSSQRIQSRKGELTKSLAEARKARKEREEAEKAAAKAEKAAKAKAAKEAKERAKAQKAEQAQATQAQAAETEATDAPANEESGS
ncbi:electron transport complex subunit RsxC [Marinobacterium sp. D7]|uniref:electron transport complex subunit RsxC n=1 Tax=Marinobacterium ramblicola TaxID=2849041 RepID=UPI001C2DEF26|nr:electron transport complex subunit RsxC [Marinobacterium ramblicola]MBV1788504.1 electron transport complex subunit RsxC [Marinobacterium ramblicola]